MKNEITIQENSLLFDVARFEHAQRVGKMLSSSTMVPDHFRNNIGNCVIALNYAHRAGVDPFMAMQKMYIIHGKPAVETQLQIALFNKAGRFSPLNYKISGKDDDRQCYAYANDLESRETINGPVVSIAMAKAEGWYSKKGSKWQTLPELMLRYRAAAFFIRLYAPETTLGLQTTEEMSDIGEAIDITPEKELSGLIEQEANETVIDITPDTDPAPGTVLTDDEKAEIEAQEMASEKDINAVYDESKKLSNDGPNF